MVQHAFFDAQTQFKGMWAGADPRALPPGAVQVAQNVRSKRNTPEVRGAIAVKTTSGITTGTLKGWDKVNLQGTEYMVVAIRDSGTTKVYISSDTTTTPTFTEITATAGKYPDTRFSDDGNVCFSVVRDPSDSTLAVFENTVGWDLLVFSNGVETMVYAPAFGLFAAFCSKVQKAWHSGIGTIKQWAQFPCYWSMLAADITASASDADVTVANNQAHPTTAGKTPYASFGTAVETDGTDFAKFLCTTRTGHLCLGADLVIVYDTVNFADPWSCLKIQVSTDDVTYKTVYTPGTDDAPPVIAQSKSFDLAAFKIDITAVPDADYQYIKFTWAAGHAPAAAADIYFFAFLGGGYMTGDWTLGASYYMPASWTESIGIVAEDQGGRSLKLMGLQDARNDVPVVVDGTVRCAYSVEYTSPAQADLEKGLTHLLVYGTRSATADLLVMGQKVLGTYSAPNWTLTNTALSRQRVTVNTETPQGSRKMPDGLNEPIPACASMRGASGRLFCGKCVSQNASGTSRGGDVMVSWQDSPFRFRVSVAPRTDGTGPDEDSGNRILFHGEQVQQLSRLTGTLNDQDTLMVHTEDGAWMMGGRSVTALSRPVRVARYGTKSPWSVTVYDDAVYWLDPDKRFMKWRGGQLEHVGRLRFDTVLSAIPDSRLPYVSAYGHKDLIVMGYTIGGGSTNTVAMVYDTVQDIFVRDAPTYSTTFGGFFSFNDELRYWTEAGVLRELDASSGTQDGGTTDISVNITTAEFSGAPITQECQFSDPWVYCEADSGKSLTLAITGLRNPTGASSGSVSLTASGTDAYVKVAPSPDVGCDDDSAYVTLSGAISARKKIKALGFMSKPKPGEWIQRA